MKTTAKKFASLVSFAETDRKTNKGFHAHTKVAYVHVTELQFVSGKSKFYAVICLSSGKHRTVATDTITANIANKVRLALLDSGVKVNYL